MSEASKTPVTDATCRGCNGNGEVGSPNPEIGNDRCPFCKGSGVETKEEEIKTPITDAATHLMQQRNHEWRAVVDAEVAEEIETQLTAARADSERLAAALEVADKVMRYQNPRQHPVIARALSAHKALTQKENEL